MLPRAFISGGSGLLGLNILLHRPERFNFYALENKRQIKLSGVKTVTVDLGNLTSIERVLKSCSPQLLIHAAGMTNVDSCNEDPLKANFINGTLAMNLAKVCFELGIKFIQISTDHLFDGTKSFVAEETPTKPLNAYGSSKALGEEGVIKSNLDALIVRCNFFGWGPSYKPSFSDFIFNNLSKGKAIRLADDIFYTPVIAQNLINGIYSLVDRDASGVFNVVGSERLSKYEFGIKMAEIFKLSSSNINRVSVDDMDFKADRPKNMALDVGKISSALSYDFPNVEDAIKLMKSQYDKNSNLLK